MSSPPPSPLPSAFPPPAPMALDPMKELPKARQIVSINEEGTNFTLDEEALRLIFHQVPEDMKVAIFSVVGAFRTGKSFILDLFLRYLRHASHGRMLKPDGTQDENAEVWKAWIKEGVTGSGEEKLEGNSNVKQTYGEKGFSWRAGRKRNTTGIWMWEAPFIRKSQTGEDIAVFLIDTQGMFDSETSQMLTASIFGLSTLLSSYQIYNVDKRVQEDNLQHLALFTEYGRMALFGDASSSSLSDKQQALQHAASLSDRNLTKTMSSISDKDEEPTNDNESNKEEEDEVSLRPRPFQRLDFLVRDWQDFSRNQTLTEKREDMEQYMLELLSSRKQKDLADTREQISSCFEKVSCFLLPHPGHAVTEREYDGSVEAIDNRFLELLTAYLDDLFDPANLFPKKIHGVTVTSRELYTYIKTYAGLFREASIFPEAKTLLEATAEANNVNQRDKALLKYKREMETLAGSNCQYVPVQTLENHHKACLLGAMDVFDDGARMGRRSEIVRYRQELADLIEKERHRYLEINAERDPYKNLEYYLIPGCVALALLVFRISQDLLCYEHIGYDLPLYDCKQVSHTLSHLYWALIVFMLLIMMSTGQVMFKRVKTVISIVKTAIDASKDDGKEKKE
ncbi:atlastin-like protein [Plasmopara halstedii]|uniref:Atlastin-like protein n=1 Tax=Plasmopara halstedii TaxID=4781 RepID=A0A0P1A576_PLAHL|nr:atlastin-like protein [Plasmopara halstedii]CEG35335.1 atlastin-like protein [Plasmopara halstedii]|eukprot:XP_024571704.1 atlastin-like protein [Plasmopara halstedii]